MNEDSAPSDIGQFLRAWLRSPLKVGAIAPSSPWLARAITKEISSTSGPILELGPGTGVFTRAMLDKGIARENLTLVERDPGFAKLLSARFPGVRIVTSCATQLSEVALFDVTGASAVVSGLPLLSLPPADILRILSGAFAQLRADGTIYQFTYRPACPVPKDIMQKLDLKAACTGFSLRNLPPAWVFAIRRKNPAPRESAAEIETSPAG